MSSFAGSNNFSETYCKCTDSITVDEPLDHVFQAYSVAIEGSKFYKEKKTNNELFQISLKTKMSHYSNGEMVTLLFNDLGGATEVTATSELSEILSRNFSELPDNMKEFLIDKNKRNVQETLGLMKEILVNV